MKSDILRKLDWVRIAAVAPKLEVAAISTNVQAIEKALDEEASKGADIVLFPELCLGGCTVGDLHHQSIYQEASIQGLASLIQNTDPKGPAFVVGLPLSWEGRLYNVAAFIANGELLGMVPKIYPCLRYGVDDRRWFASGSAIHAQSISLFGKDIPFGWDLVFCSENLPDLRIGLEVGSDTEAIEPPGEKLVRAGATLILNPCSLPMVIGSIAAYRSAVKQQSTRCKVAYVAASAGLGESTTDRVFSGHLLIVENGKVLAEDRSRSFESNSIVTDVDVDAIRLDRLRTNFLVRSEKASFRNITFSLPDISQSRSTIRRINATPFICQGSEEQRLQCEEVFEIQSNALAKRIKVTGTQTAILGISGGLDSALALLVTAKAFDQLQIDRKEILAVVLPGPGTSDRTRFNAEKLSSGVGATTQVISITDSVQQHLQLIAHDMNARDVTYENAQARKRTHILMDLANQRRGLVVGTGDLSEAALGWCTYNGDHMAMYDVNIGVPKTLVRKVLAWAIQQEFAQALKEVVTDILNTPISPELLPTGADHSNLQETEKILGPYSVHDFFLHAIVQCGFRPTKVLELACIAFAGTYERRDLLEWLKRFLKRFFSQQFKRSCAPDGPAIGSVSLSPRGSWVMPSDALSEVWLADLEEIGKG